MLKNVITNKQRLLKWFKYHHYSTNPAQENHSKFIHILNTLESMTDTVIDEINSDTMWKLILKCVNTLTEEQIDKIFHLIYKLNNYENKIKNR